MRYPYTPAQVDLARQLFARFHSVCFWRLPRELTINETRVEFVRNQLEERGGEAAELAKGLLPVLV
jgi:hypothetical protein